MFWVVFPPIIRSAYNCIYSIWYLSHRSCYLPLSWKSWNRFESAVGGIRHLQPTAHMGSISLCISFAASIFFAHKKRTTPRCSIVVHVFRGATILYQLLRLYSHAHTDLCASQ